MSLISDLERLELAELYGVANTPASFRRSLLNSSIIQRLARDVSEADLSEELRLIVCTEVKVDTELAEAYGLLLAILLQRRNEGRIGDLPESAESLEWGQYYFDLEDRNQITTSITNGSVQAISSLPNMLTSQGGAIDIQIVRG